MTNIQFIGLFRAFVAIVAAILSLALADYASANLRYIESFMADGVNSGSDNEGLAGASFTFSFVTDTPHYVSTGRLDIPVATAPFAEVTITGSTVAANNTTLRSSQHPVAVNSPCPRSRRLLAVLPLLPMLPG